MEGAAAVAVGAAALTLAEIGAAGYLIGTFTPVVYTGVIQSLTHYDAQEWKDVEDRVLVSSAAFIVGKGEEKLAKFAGDKLGDVLKEKFKGSAVDVEKTSALWSVVDAFASLTSGAISKIWKVVAGRSSNAGGEIPAPPSIPDDPGAGDPGSNSGDPRLKYH